MILITVVAALIIVYVVPTVSDFLYQWQHQFESHTQIQ